MKILKFGLLESFLIGIIFITVTFISQKPVFASDCVSISSNLSYGATDRSSGGLVTVLQDYLHSIGLLTPTATGHFGPATRAAVKVFQTNNNISSTGTVGPLTRAAISRKTCISAPVVATSSVPAIPPVVPPATPSVTPTVSNVDIVSPATGQVLSIGSSTAIRWNKTLSGVFNITLEQPGGAGAGFIATNLSSGFSNTTDNRYIWKVGSIYSSQTNTNSNVVAGTYRIRLQSTAAGSASTDLLSGWFTIVASQLSVASVMPRSAPADGVTSVVLFGSGFSSYSSIYFDTNFSGKRATNSYVSPDGTVLVFTVPTTVSATSHTLFMNNETGGSTSFPFTVSAIQ